MNEPGNRLDLHIEALLDGKLDTTGVEDLRRLIAGDPRNAKRLLQATYDEALLRDLLRPSSSRLTSTQPLASSVPRRARSRRLRGRPLSVAPAWLFPVAAAALVLIAVLVVWPAGTPASHSANGPVVVSITGSGNAPSLATDHSVVLHPGLRLPPDQRLDTNDRTVSLAWDGQDTALTLRPHSGLSVADGRAIHLHLHQGSLRALVAPQPSDAPLIITTDHATCTVVGTVFALDADAERTHLHTDDGRIRFQARTGGATAMIDAGTGATVTTDGRLTMDQVAPPAPTPPPATTGAWRDHPLGTTTPFTTGAPATWNGSGADWTQSDTDPDRIVTGSGGRSPTTNLLFPLGNQTGDLRLDATVTLTDTTDIKAKGSGAWGFGLIATSDQGQVILRLLQNSSQKNQLSLAVGDNATSTDLSIPRQGIYRLNLLIERTGAKARVTGTCTQIDTGKVSTVSFPDASFRSLKALGFTTIRCAAGFHIDSCSMR